MQNSMNDRSIRTAEQQGARNKLRELLGLMALTFGALLLLSLLTYHPKDPSWNVVGDGIVRNKAGLVGAYLADFFWQFFGQSAFVMVVLSFIFAFAMLMNRRLSLRWMTVFGYFCIGLFASALLHLWFGARGVKGYSTGGVWGQMLGNWLTSNLGQLGGQFVLLLSTGTALLWTTRFSFHRWIDGALQKVSPTGRRWFLGWYERLLDWRDGMDRWQQSRRNRAQRRRLSRMSHHDPSFDDSPERQELPSLEFERSWMKRENSWASAPREMRAIQEDSLPELTPPEDDSLQDLGHAQAIDLASIAPAPGAYDDGARTPKLGLNAAQVAPPVEEALHIRQTSSQEVGTEFISLDQEQSEEQTELEMSVPDVPHAELSENRAPTKTRRNKDTNPPRGAHLLTDLDEFVEPEELQVHTLDREGKARDHVVAKPHPRRPLQELSFHSDQKLFSSPHSQAPAQAHTPYTSPDAPSTQELPQWQSSPSQPALSGWGNAQEYTQTPYEGMPAQSPQLDTPKPPEQEDEYQTQEEWLPTHQSAAPTYETGGLRTHGSHPPAHSPSRSPETMTTRGSTQYEAPLPNAQPQTYPTQQRQKAQTRPQTQVHHRQPQTQHDVPQRYANVATSEQATAWGDASADAWFAAGEAPNNHVGSDPRTNHDPHVSPTDSRMNAPRQAHRGIAPSRSTESSARWASTPVQQEVYAANLSFQQTYAEDLPLLDLHGEEESTAEHVLPERTQQTLPTMDTQPEAEAKPKKKRRRRKKKQKAETAEVAAAEAQVVAPTSTPAKQELVSQPEQLQPEVSQSEQFVQRVEEPVVALQNPASSQTEQASKEARQPKRRKKKQAAPAPQIQQTAKAAQVAKTPQAPEAAEVVPTKAQSSTPKVAVQEMEETAPRVFQPVAETKPAAQETPKVVLPATKAKSSSQGAECNHTDSQEAEAAQKANVAIAPVQALPVQQDEALGMGLSRVASDIGSQQKAKAQLQQIADLAIAAQAEEAVITPSQVATSEKVSQPCAQEQKATQSHDARRREAPAAQAKEASPVAEKAEKVRSYEDDSEAEQQVKPLPITDKPPAEYKEAIAPEHTSPSGSYDAQPGQPVIKEKIRPKKADEVKKPSKPAWEIHGYDPPSLDYLDYEEQQGEDIIPEALIQNAEILEQTLVNFGVRGKVKEILPGPVITLYEYLPEPGIKVSKIAGLADDLAMALHALQVRVIAPIPGKGVVGIEIPNKKREIVYLREILADDKFQESQAKLPMAMGKDTTGHPYVANLAKMPHLLVAGTTGSGKSVGVNGMICSLLYHASPEDVRFIMIDPKMLELSIYDGIPHLLLPVITEPKKASVALAWAVAEMERRYALMAGAGVRNVNNYNKLIKRRVEARDAVREREVALDQAAREQNPQDFEWEEDSAEYELEDLLVDNPSDDYYEKLPYIVIIIDELADLMMVAAREVEFSIARLAQMARAAGLHLLLATQRPSVDVLTGVIKANFPSRIAFQVKSKIDSRTILDAPGAERLLGAGDMLLNPPTSSTPIRIHGAFVSEEEIHRIVKHLKKQGSPDYNEDILKNQAAEEDEDDFVDELYDQAVDIVLRSRKASISSLQRKLRIGYNRSARMIEQMEREGVIGPQVGNSPRDILVPAPEV